MDTGQSLLAAIRATPLDDLPRLAYADWLDENGQSERAKWLRASVRFDRNELVCQRDGQKNGMNSGRSATNKGKYSVSNYWRPRCRCSGCEDARLAYFTSEHSPKIEYAPLGDHGFPSVVTDIDRGFISTVYCQLWAWCGGDCPRCAGTGHASRFLPSADGRSGMWVADHSRHGQPCDFCLRSGQFSGIGPRAVCEHPVERVVLTDREPDVETEITGDLATWQSEDQSRPSWVPQDIIVELFRASIDGPANGRTGFCFYNAEHAQSAMSSALIRWAKSQTPALVSSQ